jgi:hypothetical protein
MGRLMIKKKKMAILFIILVLALGYVAIDIYSEIMVQEQFLLFQQGAQFGYEQAVTQLFQQAASCQPVPVFFNNNTINVIAVECLQELE